MSLANPFWGCRAMLATEVWPTSMPSLRSSPWMRPCHREHSSVANPRRIASPLCQDLICDMDSRPPGQSWWTFLRNHTPEIAAMDLFVVPTLAFSLLSGFIIVRLDRRELVWIGVTVLRRREAPRRLRLSDMGAPANQPTRR